MFANIDVIIPCYNAEQTLSRAVQSVLSQTYLGKIWLIDDGSKDNTSACARMGNTISGKDSCRVYVEK